MNLMFEIHQDLPREGPGDEPSTRRAYEMMTWLPAQGRILDIACGPGMQTIHLAQMSNAAITAIDTHEPYLAQLQRSAAQAGVSDRITRLKMSMFELDFDQPFDVLWCEGAIYIMGFEVGLKAWRGLLKSGGYLAATEISWLKPNPPAEIRCFWEVEYPGMQSIEDNLECISRQGYRLVGHFTLPESAWWDSYYTPLESHLTILRQKYAQNPEALSTLANTQLEIDHFRRYAEWYGYEFYIIQK